ncbi:MAG TPA: sigma-70 family RNA polymerase sigma factor, partial [Saprospiraceae bacterium]|nr:sigma-70 family RNA polymerase sigma factor [Saprospiraceae bacterium]
PVLHFLQKKFSKGPITFAATVPTIQFMHPDFHYIQSLLDNHHTGISAIYAKFSAGIARFVRANSGSTDDAQDVFQEALVIITRQARRPGFQLTCPFEAYLYMVCRGRWLNELKRRQRAAVTIAEADGYRDKEDAGILADAALREDARNQLFRRFFDKLSAGCRQILQLAWTPNTSMEEVSTQLGVSYNYARKRKSECIAQLMDWIRATPEFAALR